MKLREFKKIIDEGVKRAGKTDPLIIIYDDKEREYEIKRIGQTGLIPDVTIKIKRLKVGKGK